MNVQMKMLRVSIKLVLAGFIFMFMHFPRLWAQPDSLLPGYGKKNFKIATTQPEFEGGVQELYNWISTHIDLQELEAAMQETQMEPQRLMVRFWVQADGAPLNFEILPLNGYQDHPVANTLLKALKDLPDFTEPAVDAYDNATVYNYVIPVWVHGNRIKVGNSKYAIDELENRDGKWYFGSYPFSGMAMRYHANGKKAAEHNYKNGLLDGKAIYWDENEEELYREGYVEGEVVVCLDGIGGTCRMRCEGGTPRFLPGLDSLELLRSQNLGYPLHRCGRGGRVEVMIQIDREGKIATARVIDAGPEGYARFAMEFLYTLPPKWEPCTVEGKPVETRIVFPVEFDSYVNREDSLKYIGGIAHFEGKPFTGWMFAPGPQLDPLQKGRFVEGKKEGLWQSWDIHNRPKAELNYYQNQLHGPAVQWDTLGREVIREWWENGVRKDLTEWEYNADTTGTGSVCYRKRTSCIPDWVPGWAGISMGINIFD